MIGRLDRMLVTPWQACGYRGKACRRRQLLLENSSNYLNVSVHKYTGGKRWNYSIEFRDSEAQASGGIIIGTYCAKGKAARFNGFTFSEEKSKAIVDEFLTTVLKMELITLEQMKRYKVMS